MAAAASTPKPKPQDTNAASPSRKTASGASKPQTYKFRDFASI